MVGSDLLVWLQDRPAFDGVTASCDCHCKQRVACMETLRPCLGSGVARYQQHHAVHAHSNNMVHMARLATASAASADLRHAHWIGLC
jgi:hypothetical protein